jgi:16S rRNA (guanine527-N7)-methyltransferase
MLSEYLTEIGISPNEILKKFDVFTDMLLKWNEKINLTAITSPADIETKHYIDSLTVFKTGKITDVGKIADIGCGAGFPGFPVKFACPGVSVTLIDSLNKRVNFQNEVISALKLTGIEAVHGRGEDLGQNPRFRGQYDIVTARAVAALPSLIEICVPFLKQGGCFIAQKGAEIKEEISASKKALNALNAEIENIISFDLPYTDNKRNIIVIKKIGQTSPKYPRPAPKPVKTPIL